MTSFADRVRNARRPAPEFAPGDADEDMEAQSSEDTHAPQHSIPPQDTTRKQQPQQHVLNVGASANHSNDPQDPQVDEDGFREPPKSKRTKRRRNRRSRQGPASEAVFTGDEEESELSESQEEGHEKVPRTDMKTNEVSSALPPGGDVAGLSGLFGWGGGGGVPGGLRGIPPQRANQPRPQIKHSIRTQGEGAGGNHFIMVFVLSSFDIVFFTFIFIPTGL